MKAQVENSEYDKKIISLALQGKPSSEIASILNAELSTIEAFISVLNNPKKKQYNPQIANTIKLERNLRQEIIDKDELEEIVALALQGNLDIEIACYLSSTEQEVKRKIEFLKNPQNLYYDPKLYQRIRQKQAVILQRELMQRLEKLEVLGYDLQKMSKSPTVKQFKHIKNVKAFILDYIETGMTAPIHDLATKYGISESNVRLILSGKKDKDIVLQVINEETYQKIINSYATYKISIPKTRIFYFEMVSPAEKVKLQNILEHLGVYFQFLLTFQISLEQFASIVGISNLQILKKQIYNQLNNNQQKSLTYLWECYVPSHSKTEDARYQSAALYFRGMQRYPQYYEIYARKLLEIDFKYHELLKRKGLNLPLQQEQADIICQYRLKYGISQNKIPFDNRNVIQKCSEKYLNDIAELADYNRYKQAKNHQRKSYNYSNEFLDSDLLKLVRKDKY